MCFSILNKLTPERFDKLSLELLNVGIDSEKTLRGLIILVSVGIFTPTCIFGVHGEKTVRKLVIECHCFM